MLKRPHARNLVFFRQRERMIPSRTWSERLGRVSAGQCATRFIGGCYLWLLVGAIGCSMTTPAAAHEATFLAGAAAVDITPQKGVLLDGPISKNGPVTHIHDPLLSRALVLQHGQAKFAIVINDACMINREVCDEARRIAARETGIAADCMLISATHSHAAVRAMHMGKGPLDVRYHQQLAGQIAAAIGQANGNLAPATIGFGAFDEHDLFACRRFLCKEGTVSKNPFGELGERVKSVAGSSDGLLRPAGPIDPQISVLSIRHSDGEPLAVLANCSAHYCGGYRRGWVSADYFGAFARHLESRLEGDASHPDVVAMMSNGTSGDAGATKLPGKFAPFERLEKVGQQLAERTFGVLEQIEHQVPAAMAVAYSKLELAVRRPDAARLAWAGEVLADPNAELPHRWSPVYAREAVELSQYPPRQRLMLQALRIGNVGIAAIPCEVFGETGLAIKEQSPLDNTFTIELANGYYGYLPPPPQHQLGGYETWPARSSRLEVEAEPKIRREILRLLHEVAER